MGKKKKIIKNNEELNRLFVQFVANENFVLVMGAGCSISCGLPNFNNLKKRLIMQLKGDIINRKSDDPINLEEFDELWEAAGHKFRTTIMYNVVTKRPPHLGAYYSLAHLVKNGYFSKIINYNFDNYLEFALHSRGIDWFLTLVNGCHDINYVKKEFNNDRLPMILKTHGDYKHGVFCLSRKEMIEFSGSIRDIINKYTSEKIIIIGYSGTDYPFMRDIDLSKEGEEIWFVNPAKPPVYLMDIMTLRRSQNNWIQLTFDDFFYSIHHRLKTHLEPEAFSGRKRKSLMSRGRSRDVTIKNRLGLHARAAAKISHLANSFTCDIWIVYKGERVNMRSSLGILTLEIPSGAVVTLEASGPDEIQALDAIVDLINRKFDEES